MPYKIKKQSVKNLAPNPGITEKTTTKFMQNMPAYTPTPDNTLAIQVEELKIRVSELQKQCEDVQTLKI